jgi:proline iminopeptidase
MISRQTPRADWSFSKQGYIEVLGGRIWYGVVSGGNALATPLLAIHGGPGMSHDYLYPLVDLADERPIVFYDQLDAGRSDRPNDPSNWRIERFLSEIDVVRENLDLKTLSIFGNSWGGTLAAAYTSSHPIGVEKLILSSPLLNTERWVADNAIYRESLPDEIQKVMLDCEMSGRTNSKAYQDAVDVFYKSHLCRSDPWPSYVTDTFETLNDKCYVGMWGPNEFTCTGVLRGYDGTPDLSSIEVPTLMTFGEHDEAAPASCREYALAIPSVSCAEFANASHLAFVEDRDNYISVVRSFLSD